MSQLNWYAVYTRPRWEKRVAERLTQKGIVNYCPLNRVLRQWHDRKKLVLEPLFTMYVFVRIDPKSQLNALQTNGVINFVSWLGKPAVIKDEEIHLIQQFLHEHINIHVEKADLQLDDEVMISDGPLLSYKGKIVEIKNKTVKLLIPSLKMALYAEVDKLSIVKANR